MVRPNVDIPWSTHGKVKEYAEDEGVSLSEAYDQLLEGGLGHQCEVEA